LLCSGCSHAPISCTAPQSRMCECCSMLCDACHHAGVRNALPSVVLRSSLQVSCTLRMLRQRVIQCGLYRRNAWGATHTCTCDGPGRGKLGTQLLLCRSELHHTLGISTGRGGCCCSSKELRRSHAVLRFVARSVNHGASMTPALSSKVSSAHRNMYRTAGSRPDTCV
jgi:hypothetical protein